jgi:hypothetical protein
MPCSTLWHHVYERLQFHDMMEVLRMSRYVFYMWFVAGQTRNVEKLWRDFFADPSQWLDHRSEKVYRESK